MTANESVLLQAGNLLLCLVQPKTKTDSELQLMFDGLAPFVDYALLAVMLFIGAFLFFIDGWWWNDPAHS